MSVEKQIKNFENKPFKTLFIWLVFLTLIGTGVSIVGSGLGWFTNAAKVANQEFSPEAMLKKYEWFKDAAASLDKKQANISAYKSRINSFKEDYEGKPKSEWPRDDRQSYNQINAEYQGMLQMYNSVVADYNSQSNKFNWKSFDKTNDDNITKHFKIKG